MMSEVLGKVLWRLYVFIFIVSVSLLSLGTKFLWDSIVAEVKTELIYSNKIVSRSLFSLLSKDEILFHISGERLVELGLFKNNPESIKLLDYLLENNQELAGISIANPQGEIFLSSSNFKTENLPNLLQKEETKESFNRALNSDTLVMGRTYFLNEYNDWIVPIRYRILNKKNEVVAVIDAWARAWSAQNEMLYLSFYADDFQLPEGMSRAAWERERKNRINSPDYIQVDGGFAQFELVDNNSIEVYLRQGYSSDSYSDFTNKLVKLRKSDGLWKIVQEVAL